jgi:hypothetical protein
MSKLGKHKTIRTELKQSIGWLESLSEVSRVILGLTDNCRHKYAPGVLRYRRDVDGGFLVNGYHGNGVTGICVIVEEGKAEEVRKLIEERFGD